MGIQKILALQTWFLICEYYKYMYLDSVYLIFKNNTAERTTAVCAKITDNFFSNSRQPVYKKRQYWPQSDWSAAVASLSWSTLAMSRPCLLLLMLLASNPFGPAHTYTHINMCTHTHTHTQFRSGRLRRGDCSRLQFPEANSTEEQQMRQKSNTWPRRATQMTEERWMTQKSDKKDRRATDGTEK